MEFHGYTNAKGLRTMIMIAQCPWRSGKMLLSFTGYQCQNYLEGFIAKSLVDVSCTAKEPTGSVAVYGQGNTSFNYISGRLYRGHVSNSLGYQLIWCSMIHWAFWHRFYWNLPKKWDSAALKPKSSKGGLWGGLKNDNLGQIFYFTWYFIDFSAVMYLFKVKESTFKSFVKIGLSLLNKMAVLRQIKARGRFCYHAHILIYFCVFWMSGIR